MYYTEPFRLNHQFPFLQRSSVERRELSAAVRSHPSRHFLYTTCFIPCMPRSQLNTAQHNQHTMNQRGSSYTNLEFSNCEKVQLGNNYNNYDANEPEILDPVQLAEVLRKREQRCGPVSRIEKGFPTELETPKVPPKASGAHSGVFSAAWHEFITDKKDLFLEYCRAGEISKVRKLLARGLNPDKGRGAYGSALQIAVVTNQEDLFDLLID